MYDMTGPINAGLNWAQGLNQALAQHQQLQEQQRASLANEAMRQAEIDAQGNRDQANKAHQGLADQLSVMANGGSPVDANGNYQGPSATSTPNPNAPQNTDDPVLNAAANQPMTGPVMAQAQPGRTVTAGGQKYAIPTQQEAAQNDLDQRVKTARALQSAKGGMVRLGNSIAGPLGIDPDTEVPIESIGSISEAAERAKPTGPKYQFHYESDGAGNVTAFRTDAGSGEVVKAGTFRGAAGGKAAGAVDPSAPPDKRTAAAIQLHDKLFDQENQIHAVRQQMGFDITQPDGESVVDPQSGKEVLMGKARRTFYQQQVDSLGTQAKGIESQRQQLRQNFKIGEFAPTAAAPKQNAGTQAPKVFPQARLAEYAAKNKLTPAAAMAQIKQLGYAVQ